MAELLSPTITPEIEARFWARVDKTPGQGPHGDCWCWTGPLMYPDNYPNGFSITVDRKPRLYRASHIALAISGKARPLGLMALHSCDWKPCVRPDHLRWGTNEENLQDHLERGKPQKLTKEDVRAIRASVKRPCDIAREFGIAQSHVSAVRNRLIFKHLE